MKNLHAAALAVLLVTLLSGCDEVESIPAGLGYAAQEMCARVFVGGDDATRVKYRYVAPMVFPLDKIWNVEVDRSQQRVTVSEFLTHQRATAVFRPGLGCTKLVDISARDLRAQPFTPYRHLPTQPGYWPLGHDGVTPGAANAFHTATLDRAFTDLMNAPEYNTQAILLAHNGRLVRKAYRSGYSDSNRFTGWSMSKTVTAITLGVAHKRLGNFSLDESAARFYPSWRGTSREAITLRHLLNMESGLNWDENYEGKSTTSEMYYGSRDMAAYVATRPLAYTPGSRFYYSSGDTMLLSGIVKQLAGGTLQASNDFYHNFLFAPLGITTAVIQPDVSGSAVGAAHNYMSAEDWLRMGQLVLNRGRWGNQQVVDASWIDELARRTTASGGSYGGQVWTYYADPMAQYGLPEDIFLFHGVQHQLMAVIPSRNLVFLRLGVFTGDESDANFNNSIRPYFTALQRVLAAQQ